MVSRRDFILTSLGGIWLSGIPGPLPGLYTLSDRLLRTWGEALLALQVRDPARTADHGGIWCPADKAVHGRCGDAIYPFYYLAKITGQRKWIDAASLLYRWMERRVSQPDGSWLNEPQQGSWKGTTVFSATALAETLTRHGDLMEPAFRTELKDRLLKAGWFIHSNFNIDYGNINYPISATYALTLLGSLLNVPAFTAKGRELAQQALKFITAGDGLLFGEGDPYYQPSTKGCLSVDLGYNVEESLPALVQYGLLTGDQTVLAAAQRSLRAHLAFMLPDGAWDNSWGTRNYKWTYWGSRTSDGCQPGYVLLQDRDPVFYTAALMNTRLMSACTHEGLLCGGPHCHEHGVPVCVHHTFSHIKGLVTILERRPAAPLLPAVLPRAKDNGLQFFKDIQTCLVAAGGYRATVTVYDREYKHSHNGHASGGALTMLWHEKTGPLLAAGMNEYQLIEAGNMQKDEDPLSMPLTPRVQLKLDGRTFMNISCLDATMEFGEEGGRHVVHTRSRLVDAGQQDPPGGPVICLADYSFGKEEVTIRYRQEGQGEVIIPVISAAREHAALVDEYTLGIRRAGAVIRVTCMQGLERMPVSGQRAFNFVPGFECIPLRIVGSDVLVRISVSSV